MASATLTATAGELLLSLVVLSYRRFDDTTGPCLESLAGAEDTPGIELILVDNASDDGAAERCAQVAADRPRLRFLPQSANLGFGGGMNRGVEASRGDWVCLVNSDTVFPHGALQALQHTLRRLPARIAMIGPVTNAAGNGQRLPLPDVAWASVAPLGSAAMEPPTGLLTPCSRTDFFCVAIRRAVWRELGGLDPAFQLGYYEDFDFSLRLARAGWDQRIAEDVFVAHMGSATFSSMGAAQKALLKRNRALLRERHPAVRFEHVREGNAAALRYLVEQARTQGWTEALRRRAAWRLAALDVDEPRSPFKRWRWRWACRSLRAELASHGITARFPSLPPPRSPA